MNRQVARHVSSRPCRPSPIALARCSRRAGSRRVHRAASPQGRRSAANPPPPAPPSRCRRRPRRQASAPASPPSRRLSARGYVRARLAQGAEHRRGRHPLVLPAGQIAGASNNVDLFFANLLLDGHFGIVGLHIEPRFRDSRLRAFYPAPSGRRRPIVSVNVARDTVIKAGKAVQPFWPVLGQLVLRQRPGLRRAEARSRLRPVARGRGRPDGRNGLRYYAQYFVVDGHTNVSLDGRDTISIPGASRRNQTILRAEPFFRPNQRATTTRPACRASSCRRTLPIGHQERLSRAARRTVSVRNWSACGPNTPTRTARRSRTSRSQPARHDHDAPRSPGKRRPTITTASPVTRYTVQEVTLRYNVSTGRYPDARRFRVAARPGAGGGGRRQPDRARRVRRTGAATRRPRRLARRSAASTSR